jgi:hypothetical protein
MPSVHGDDVMLVRCHELDTKGRLQMAGWLFRSETWREEWRWTRRPGNDLPDIYVVPNEELYPPDALRLLVQYRNPNGTPDRTRWPTPEQFQRIMKDSRWEVPKIIPPAMARDPHAPSGTEARSR